MNRSPRISPYRVGLTGNIATGKSTVARILHDLGAEVLDADRMVHAFLTPNGAAYLDVLEVFGGGILDRDGAIDRQALGTLVFGDPAALVRLEAILHPLVIDEVDRRIAVSRAPVIVVEAIKLLESGMAGSYQTIWVTTCSESTQLERLMALRHLSRADALQRIRAQPPQGEKLARADVILYTDSTLEHTREQVLAAWTCVPGHLACIPRVANGVGYAANT